MVKHILLAILLSQCLMTSWILGLKINLASSFCILYDFLCLNNTLSLPYDANLKLPEKIEQQDFTQITFTTWKYMPDGTIKEENLEYKNDEQAKRIFEGSGRFLIYFHGVQHTAKDNWTMNVVKTKDAVGQGVVFSVGYEKFFTSDSQAVANIEAISDRCFIVFDWILTKHIGASSYRESTAHGMGCYVASRTEEKLQQHTQGITKQHFFTHLDPNVLSEDILQNLKGNPKPEITRSIAKIVNVYHTSTCSHSPPIKSCDNSTSETLGIYDFIFNGGAVQPGCNIIQKNAYTVELMQFILTEEEEI